MGVVELGIEGLTGAVEIGRGGFGVVYRAQQPALERTVAVKVLTVRVVDDEARRRFKREAGITGSLSGHTHIVAVHDAGFTGDGFPYLVMEDMEGGSLADVVARDGPLPWPQAVDVGMRMAEALDAAHAAGVLHRDVKPENILLSRYGVPKLADFGIARREIPGATRTAAPHLSIAHAAPEILSRGRATALADVYSLASTVHALVAGRPPFIREDDDALAPVLRRIASEPPPPLPAGVPPPVEEVLRSAMAKRPSDRPPSAAAFGHLLATAAGVAPTAAAPPDLPVPARRATRRRTLAVVIGSVAVLLVALAAGVVASRHGSGSGTASTTTSQSPAEPTTAHTQGPLTEAQLASILLQPADLGNGYAASTSTTTLAGFGVCNVSAQLAGLTHEADAAYATASEAVELDAAAFAQGAAAAYLQSQRSALASCGGVWTAPLATQTVQVKAHTVEGPALGDDALRLEIDAYAPDGKLVGVLDEVQVRAGDAVLTIEYAHTGTAAPERVTQLAREELTRLQALGG